MKVRYAVQREDVMYYNPNVRGDRCNPTFAKAPKLYARLGDAKRGQEFCASGVNTHWYHCGEPVRFEPVATRLVKVTITETHEYV